MINLKEITRKTFQLAGYRITRMRPQNRFSAMSETLIMMRQLGYAPKIVIDGGSNIGQFAQLVRPIFPEAHVHMIEPQPACASSLQDLADRSEEHTSELQSPYVISY